NGADRQMQDRRQAVSLADELSGLGSTRVVRMLSPRRSGGNEPDDVATGTTDAEVSRRVEPLGGSGAVGAGGGRAAGLFGAAVPALPAALRGGGPGGAPRSALGQSLDAAGAGRRDR